MLTCIQHKVTIDPNALSTKKGKKAAAESEKQKESEELSGTLGEYLDDLAVE
jgi:hypothetical protein